MNRILSNIYIYPLNYSYISYEFHFAPETILGEVRIRSVRILIGLGLTWFTRYWLPEELISPLAKPFLAFGFVFCSYTINGGLPDICCNVSNSTLLLRLSLNKSSNLVLFDPQMLRGTKDEIQSIPPFKWFSLLLVHVPNSSPVVPNVWHFPYFMGETSTNSPMIKFQLKIYDHIMLTVCISFIPSVCSQVLVIVICLPEPRGLSVETSRNNRRFLMVFLLLIAALSKPPDIWCQIVAPFLISLIIELDIFVASIIQVREGGWTSGMRESGSIDKKEEWPP